MAEYRKSRHGYRFSDEDWKYDKQISLGEKYIKHIPGKHAKWNWAMG